MRGDIISQNEKQVLLRMEYGTMTLARSQIAKIEGQSLDPISNSNQRIPNWRVVIASVAKQPWAKNIQQIPATVVDKGIMRFVPYISFRIADDYELNIYGDLDNPAGIEIGLYRSLLKDDAAKTNCFAFIGSILGTNDRQVLAVLDHKQDLKVASGITFEVTPEAAEDAYGGWWVSLYDTKKLDQARASKDELAQITSSSGQANDWSRDDLQYARKLPRSVSPTATPTPSPYAFPTPTPVPTRSTGDVYVRGYYRKNGTYVHGYSRNR